MKYEYKFSDISEIIEIDEYWYNLLKSFDKSEHANDKKEKRYSLRFEAFLFEGKNFEDPNCNLDNILLDRLKKDALNRAFNCLSLKQQDLITAIYFDGISVSEYAIKEGVEQSAISHRLKTAKKNLKKFLKKSS